MWWRVIKEYILFVSLLVFHFTLQQSLYTMCLTFLFIYLKLWDNALKERKEGPGKREFRNTTNINREKRKKEKKRYTFFSFTQSLRNKRNVKLFCFGLLRSVTLSLKNSVTLYFIFPYFGERSITPRSRRGQPLG